MEKTGYVYILTNKPRGVLYTGVTSDLVRRLEEHKRHVVPGFTARYHVTRLVWFAAGDSVVGAIELEKKIKNRSRQWKINLIEESNPEWRDLSADW
jgi:putative endonuclease